MRPVVDPDVEVHRSEITRANRTTPVAVLVIVAAVVVALVTAGSDDPDPKAAPAPTTTTSTTSPEVTVPAPAAPVADRPLPPTVALGFSGPDTFVFGSVTTPLTEVRPDGMVRRVEGAVVTGERIAVIDTDGQILTGGDDGSFSALMCCLDAIIPSNEPGHVWGVDLLAGVTLVDLDRGPTDVFIDVDGERVIGLGAFGVVTVDRELAATWWRPGFDPAPVVVPDGREAVSSGGAVVAYVVPETGVVEVRRAVDGRLVRSFPATSSGSVTARLSTVGDAVAIVRRGAVEVFGLDDGRPLGGMQATGDGPVPIGAGRFAVTSGGVVVDSQGRRIDPGVDQALVATRAE